MRYSTRGIRRRGNSDKWEVILTHKDPQTGELLPIYHTVEAATEKQAKKKRDELIVRLELEGGAVGTSVTIREFMGAYLDVREKDGTLEPSTVRGYRGDAKQILKYIGDVQLGELATMKKSAVQRAVEFGVPFGDPFILGTQETESRPYNPTQLGKDFTAFCKMNGFTCTFHDLRHTFATMMIAGGCYGSSVKKTPQWGVFSEKARAKGERWPKATWATRACR